MADTVTTIDAKLLIWRSIYLTAVLDEDPAQEFEAVEELDRLLDIRYHLPLPRTA